MYLNKQSISVSAGTSKGDLEYTKPLNGYISAVEYIKSTGTALSGTATLAITGEDSGLNVLASLAVGTASFIKCPRLLAINTTNGTLTTGGGVGEKIPIAGERLKLVIAATSAASQVGTFNIYSEGGSHP